MTAARVHPLSGRLGAAAATGFLDEAGVHYQLVPHKPTFRAVASSEMLDLGKARALLGDHEARLADEREISAAFPVFDVGAIPPIGPAKPPLALFDERLVKYSRVVCAGGDHRHSLVAIPAEILAAARPVVGDICRARGR